MALPPWGGRRAQATFGGDTRGCNGLRHSDDIPPALAYDREFTGNAVLATQNTPVPPSLVADQVLQGLSFHALDSTELARFGVCFQEKSISRIIATYGTQKGMKIQLMVDTYATINIDIESH